MTFHISNIVMIEQNDNKTDVINPRTKQFIDSIHVCFFLKNRICNELH